MRERKQKKINKNTTVLEIYRCRVTLQLHTFYKFQKSSPDKNLPGWTIATVDRSWESKHRLQIGDYGDEASLDDTWSRLQLRSFPINLLMSKQCFLTTNYSLLLVVLVVIAAWWWSHFLQVFGGTHPLQLSPQIWCVFTDAWQTIWSFRPSREFADVGKSRFRSVPPAWRSPFAKPLAQCVQNQPLHDCLTDEASQVTGLTTLVLQECFHGNRFRSCEEKQKTERERERERDIEANLQHHVFLTFPSGPGHFVAVHLLHVKKNK